MTTANESPGVESRAGETGPHGFAHAQNSSLLPHHQRMLVESAISPDVAAQRKYFSAVKTEQLARLGFEGYQQRVPALVVPIYSPDGRVELYQVRPDSPREKADKPGTFVKYETVAGARMRLDVPPGARAGLGDPSVPLWITEGVRKADSAVSAGLCCIALLGVWNWRGTNLDGGKTALGEWHDVALNGRDVYVCFDSDVVEKVEVQQAVTELCSFLKSRGARSHVVRLPGGPEGAKVGLDDFLAAGHTVAELLERAAPAGISAQPNLELGTVSVGFPCTDAGQSELFAHLNADRVRYDWRRSRWLIWTPSEHRWRPDVDGAINLLVLQAARQRHEAALGIDDSAKRMTEIKFALAMESKNRIDAVRELARSQPAIRDHEDWDTAPHLLGCTNGVVDLRTGKPRDGHPGDRITMTTGIAYDPTATAPHLLRFLDEALEGDEDRIAYVHRLAGYALTGETSEQALCVATGDGGNGKSVLVSALRESSGDYAINLQMTSLLEQHNKERLSPGLAQLPGKRLAVSSEASGGRRLDAAVIKGLTGDSRYTAEAKHQAPFEFRPVAKFLLAVNELPRVTDASDSIWQRLHVLRFNVVFRGTEREDKHLEAKLLAELPGVLAWRVRGAVAWYGLAAGGQSGLQPPLSVLLAAAEWRDASNPLTRFIEERCVVRPSARAFGFGRAVREWQRDTGQRVLLNDVTVASLMRRLGFGETKRTNAGNYYEGLGFVDPSGHADPVGGSDDGGDREGEGRDRERSQGAGAPEEGAFGPIGRPTSFTREGTLDSVKDVSTKLLPETLSYGLSGKRLHAFTDHSAPGTNHCCDCGDACGSALRCQPCASKRAAR